MPALNKNIGERIKKLRERTSISQSNLAEVLGMNRVTISKIENGERKIYAEEIIKFSEYFNISSDVLLDLRRHRSHHWKKYHQTETEKGNPNQRSPKESAEIQRSTSLYIK